MKITSIGEGGGDRKRGTRASYRLWWMFSRRNKRKLGIPMYSIEQESWRFARRKWHLKVPSFRSHGNRGGAGLAAPRGAGSARGLAFDLRIPGTGLGKDFWKLRDRGEGGCFCRLWRRGLDPPELRGFEE